MGPLKLEGTFQSTDAFPALQIRTDGFAFGEGTVNYAGDVQFGSAVILSGPYVRLENFNFSTTDGLHVDPKTGKPYAAVTVPDRPPALLNGEPFSAGPYFYLRFGDPDEAGRPGGPRDPEGDGLRDVGLTLLDTFRLAGDFRVLAGTG